MRREGRKLRIWERFETTGEEPLTFYSNLIPPVTRREVSVEELLQPLDHLP